MQFNNSTPELAAECNNPDTRKSRLLTTNLFFKSLRQSNISTASKRHQIFYRQTSSTKRSDNREGHIYYILVLSLSHYYQHNALIFTLGG